VVLAVIRGTARPSDSTLSHYRWCRLGCHSNASGRTGLKKGWKVPHKTRDKKPPALVKLYLQSKELSSKLREERAKGPLDCAFVSVL
jgi:hypothetical protein